MDIAFIVIGGIILVAGLYALYDNSKPASGVRARNSKGHFVKDDPATLHKNEAYKDGKTPPKKKAPVKRKPAAKKPAAKKAPAKRRSTKKTVAKK
jgi:hypothetical protein